MIEKENNCHACPDFNLDVKKFCMQGELERTDEGVEVETDLQWR